MNQSEMKPTIFILFYFCRTLGQVVHKTKLSQFRAGIARIETCSNQNILIHEKLFKKKPKFERKGNHQTMLFKRVVKELWLSW